MGEPNTTDITDALRHIDDVEDEVARKLFKLLATAKGNGATENEMEQAMILAQRMAIKHRVDLATITDQDVGMAPPEEEMAEQLIKVGKGNRRPPADRWLISILIEFFEVEVVYHPDSRAEADGGEGSRISFLGRKSAVAWAVYAYGFMQKAFSRAWGKYKRAHDAPMSRRASFYYGVYTGLADRLREEKGIAERELLTTTQASDSYGLAVIEEKDARKAFVADKHPVLVSARRTQANIYSQDAVEKGREEGRKLQISKALE